ncbi:MAG: YidC/Oxa1 family membrane protein insertase [bacterium]|nr:YidC/Oxa1 family membrane protein insertase [bacterium]
MGAFFNIVFYQPIYNLSVFFIGIFPGHSFGMAVVATTILVKFLLYPLTKKAIITQLRMREIEPQMKAIKEKHKNNKETLARATMELYREAKLNPFAGIIAIIIQLPVIIALYLIIYKAGLPEIKPDLLYSFVSTPVLVSMKFLIFDMGNKSWILAILAGVTQFVQAYLTMPTPPKRSPGSEPSFQEDFARSMSLQMKYVLPIFIVFIGHSLSSAVALYFVVSNLFTIGQELALRKHRGAGQVLSIKY